MILSRSKETLFEESVNLVIIPKDHEISIETKKTSLVEESLHNIGSICMLAKASTIFDGFDKL